jgi:hypothetical protein
VLLLVLSQAKHQLLQKEHSQLLSRQLGVTSDRGSLRQQYLSTEEQLQAAKKQVNYQLLSSAARQRVYKEHMTAVRAFAAHV